MKKGIILRKGTHFLTTPIELDTQDNNLVITNYSGEEVWISGGVVLETNWTPYNLTQGANIYVTDLT